MFIIGANPFIYVSPFDSQAHSPSLSCFPSIHHNLFRRRSGRSSLCSHPRKQEPDADQPAPLFSRRIKREMVTGTRRRREEGRSNFPIHP
ncbi:hypothetical protein HMPREF9374_3210 [Desmospora sp. 8437]|nr:hypothetical protein HMPREF9374_3210 [Desmospora sp. 8437]